MNPGLSAFLSLRLIDRAGGHRRTVVAEWRRRMQLEAGDPAVPLAERRTRLAALLEHVGRSVPFYRGRLPAQIAPGQAEEALRTLPAIGRAQLQAEPGAFRDPTAPFTVADATGGSTGTPLRFFVDRETQRAREVSLMWADALAGWRYGDRIAMLWGSDRDSRHALAQTRTKLRWAIDNRRWYNAFDMGETQMAAFHEDLASFRPHLLVAYAGSLFTYARHLRARGLRPSYPLQAIVSSAEVLTPTMRREIEQVFPARVFDRYGNREFGAIAAQREPAGTWTVNPFDVVCESVDGELVVTHLHNRAMPFIRYRTGDAAALRERDGRTEIASIEGRRSDNIRALDGRIIHGEFFTHLLYGAQGVSSFQFVQETRTRFLLRVAAPAIATAQEQRWLDAIRREVGAAAGVRVERVDELPVLASGKRRFTISLLEGDAGGHG